MEKYNLSKSLLEARVVDYRLNSVMMPKKARILSKLFAKSLGKSAGKIISVYDNIYTQIEEGRPVKEIQDSIRKDVSIYIVINRDNLSC
jgi:hypothetical protein